MTLSPGREEQYYTQRFYLYLNLTKPQDNLYLTYSKVDASGETKNPSYLIGVMQKMFSCLEIQDEEERRKKPEAIVAPVNGMHYITGHYRRDRTQEFYALYRWFEKQPDYEARIRALRTAAMDERTGGQIHQALARALYGGELSGSVTRLERYAACAYAHFLQYGLRAGEREEFGFDHLDFGNLMHDALDKYAKELKHRNLLWTQVSEEEQKQLIELCVDRAVMERDASVLYYSARDKYRITRMKRMGVRTVWALTKQLEEGKFIPSRYELKFQSTKELKNGLDETTLLNLRGKIDRMDICETDEKVMVKVMDYKTGQKEFRLLELYSGTQLQLVVYLQAAMKFEQKRYREKEVIPAGILYYMVEDPVVEVSGEEDTKTPILKELLVDGVVREDREILAAFDRKFEEPVYSYKSGVIPVGTKKDGNFLASSKTVSEEEFQVMMDYAEMKIEQMGEDILKGDVRVNPYQSGKVTACGYCPYSDVCVQERNGARLEYRDLSNLGDSILYANMKQELKRHSEETQKEARSELQTERQNEVSGHTDGKEEREWQ